MSYGLSLNCVGARKLSVVPQAFPFSLVQRRAVLQTQAGPSEPRLAPCPVLWEMEQATCNDNYRVPSSLSTME